MKMLQAKIFLKFMLMKRDIELKSIIAANLLTKLQYKIGYFVKLKIIIKWLYEKSAGAKKLAYR